MKNKGSSSNDTSDKLVVMISKINLLEDHDMRWWKDSGATRHVYKDLTLFKHME